MSITIRQARLEDIEAIAPFVQIAGGGIAEYLLTDLIPGLSINETIEMALMDENTTYFYQHFLVAECKQTIIGASNYYPAEQHCLPDIMRSMISKDKLDRIEPYISSKVDHSMYIHTLAVAPAYRYTSCGLALGKKIEQIAKENHYQCLSAHDWRDNKPVYLGLKMAGFKEVQHIPIAEHPDLPYQGGMVLLKGPDF